MSKPLLVLLGFILLAPVESALGQGTVVFNNFYPNTNYRLWTNNPFGPSTNLMANTGGHYTIGLYVGPVGTAEGSLELVGSVGNAGLQPGYFSGVNPFQLPTPYAAGTPINFQIRAWSVAGGASYASAVSAFYGGNFQIAGGTSAVGTVTPGSSIAAPLFGTTPGLLTRGFEIHVPIIIPEPSGFAIGLLGLSTLLLFRRRK